MSMTRTNDSRVSSPQCTRPPTAAPKDGPDPLLNVTLNDVKTDTRFPIHYAEASGVPLFLDTSENGASDSLLVLQRRAHGENYTIEFPPGLDTLGVDDLARRVRDIISPPSVESPREPKSPADDWLADTTSFGRESVKAPAAAKPAAADSKGVWHIVMLRRGNAHDYALAERAIATLRELHKAGAFKDRHTAYQLWFLLTDTDDTDAIASETLDTQGKSRRASAILGASLQRAAARHGHYAFTSLYRLCVRVSLQPTTVKEHIASMVAVGPAYPRDWRGSGRNVHGRLAQALLVLHACLAQRQRYGLIGTYGESSVNETDLSILLAALRRDMGARGQIPCTGPGNKVPSEATEVSAMFRFLTFWVYAMRFPHDADVQRLAHTIAHFMSDEALRPGFLFAGTIPRVDGDVYDTSQAIATMPSATGLVELSLASNDADVVQRMMLGVGALRRVGAALAPPSSLLADADATGPQRTASSLQSLRQLESFSPALRANFSGPATSVTTPSTPLTARPPSQPRPDSNQRARTLRSVAKVVAPGAAAFKIAPASPLWRSEAVAFGAAEVAVSEGSEATRRCPSLSSFMSQRKDTLSKLTSTVASQVTSVWLPALNSPTLFLNLWCTARRTALEAQDADGLSRTWEPAAVVLGPNDHVEPTDLLLEGATFTERSTIHDVLVRSRQRALGMNDSTTSLAASTFRVRVVLRLVERRGVSSEDVSSSARLVHLLGRHPDPVEPFPGAMSNVMGSIVLATAQPAHAAALGAPAFFDDISAWPVLAVHVVSPTPPPSPSRLPQREELVQRFGRQMSIVVPY